MEPETYLVGHVREALARDGRTNELHVEITVSGDRVFLTGEVASEESRDAVAAVVEELLPAHEIHHGTAVTALGPPEAAEELR